jgi:predicted transcriptional regulator
MSAVKEMMKEIIARQPDESTFDEILRELIYVRDLQRGLDDANAGRTISDEEMERRIDSWREEI